MKLRSVKLVDLAAAIAEIVGPFSERKDHPMEIHVTGRSSNIKFLAAAVISNVFECDLDARKLSKGKFIHSRGNVTVAFIDEGGRATNRAKPGKTEATLPEEFLKAKGLLIVAHPRAQRIYQRTNGGTFSRAAKMDMHIAIRKKGSRKPSSEPQRVKMRAGGLPGSVRGEFKASLKPIARIIG